MASFFYSLHGIKFSCFRLFWCLASLSSAMGVGSCSMRLLVAFTAIIIFAIDVGCCVAWSPLMMSDVVGVSLR